MRRPRKLIGPVKNIFRGTPARPGRRPAPLQAQRLVLPHDRRGRHRLRPRRDDGALARISTGPTSCTRSSTRSPRRITRTRRCSAPATARSSRRPDGLVYHTHLCGRPLPGTRLLAARAARPRSRNASGATTTGSTSRAAASCPTSRWSRPTDAVMPLPPHGDRAATSRSCRELPIEFQWLRTPHPERLFTLTGSALRLHGRESIGSWFEQSLVARRQEDFAFRAETAVTFAPDTYQQVAGLTLLLQPLQVPLPRGHLARDAGPRAHDHVLPRRLSRRAPDLPARPRRSRCRATARCGSPPRWTAPKLQFSCRRGQRLASRRARCSTPA